MLHSIPSHVIVLQVEMEKRMKGIKKTLGMHLKVLEEKKKHRLAVIQEQKLLLPLPLTGMRGTHSMRTFIIAIAVRLFCGFSMYCI